VEMVVGSVVSHSSWASLRSLGLGCSVVDLKVNLSRATLKTVNQRVSTSNKGGDDEPLESLKEYVLADLEKYPFNEIQAMWQVDGHAAIARIQHFSSLLEDNK
jgi:hypothetical protein